jgi:hypothetical protein
MAAITEGGRMSPAKKRQTMGKMTRERELKERRALKQAKKDARKLAAAEGLEPEGYENGAEGEENGTTTGEERGESSEE